MRLSRHGSEWVRRISRPCCRILVGSGNQTWGSWVELGVRSARTRRCAIAGVSRGRIVDDVCPPSQRKGTRMGRWRGERDRAPRRPSRGHCGSRSVRQLSTVYTSGCARREDLLSPGTRGSDGGRALTSAIEFRLNSRRGSAARDGRSDALKWYELARRSHAQASHAAGQSRPDFISALGRLGVSPFQVEPDELSRELG
jgi:hypothetical protein